MLPRPDRVVGSRAWSHGLSQNGATLNGAWSPSRHHGKVSHGKSWQVMVIVIVAEGLPALPRYSTQGRKAETVLYHLCVTFSNSAKPPEICLGRPHAMFARQVLLVWEATLRSVQSPSETPSTQGPLNYSTSSPSTGIHDHPSPSSPASPPPFAGSATLPSSTASPVP